MSEVLNGLRLLGLLAYWQRVLRTLYFKFLTRSELGNILHNSCNSPLHGYVKYVDLYNPDSASGRYSR